MKKLLIGCGGLIALIVIAAIIGMLTLSGSYSVEREIEVNATPEAAYETIANISTWPEWSVWNKEMDPEATWEFSGPESGDGAQWSWSGEALGTGVMTFRDCTSPSSITYDLAFDNGAFDSTGTISITPSGEGIKLHWLNAGEMQGVMKLMAPIADTMAGPMYESGLANLKTRLEAGE